MAPIAKKLRVLLENPELRRALADAFYAGIGSSSDFHKTSLADHLRRARGVDLCETANEELPVKLAEALQSYVIDRLPQPAPITLEDLTELCVAQLAGVDLLHSIEGEHG